MGLYRIDAPFCQVDIGSHAVVSRYFSKACHLDKMKIQVQRSARRDKKYVAIIGDERVHFGSLGHSDYTIHKDPVRKANYIARHRSRENWNISGLRTAGFWSRWILWGEPTIKDSIKALNERFPSIEVVLR